MTYGRCGIWIRFNALISSFFIFKQNYRYVLHTIEITNKEGNFIVRKLRINIIDIFV